jgi:hypothetical protein
LLLVMAINTPFLLSLGSEFCYCWFSMLMHVLSPFSFLNSLWGLSFVTTLSSFVVVSPLTQFDYIVLFFSFATVFPLTHST